MLLQWLIQAAILIFTSDYAFSQKISRNKRSDGYVNCDSGWSSYKEKCYKVGTKEKLTWERAAERCVNDGGKLVTIQSKEEHDFIIALIMLEVRQSAWIGLNDRSDESEYVWDDGSSSSFRNWQEGEPSGIKYAHEDCVEIIIDFVKDSIGFWNDQTCTHTLAYVCQMEKDPYKRSPNPQYCSSADGGGFRFQSSCYHLVTTMKSWEDAEQHCIDNYKGHLLTVLYSATDIYLDYLLHNIGTELWIGIKLQDRFQQKWTSGWYVGYNGFGKEHRDFLEGTCVVRTKRKQWTVVPCSKKYSFFCEVSKVKAPVLKPPMKDSYCPEVPHGWRDLDGEFCYHIETEEPMNWYEANFDCLQRGGHLVSIHSKEENDILHPFVQYTQIAAFIGLFQVSGFKDVFRWTDGSPVDFINWSHSEPNNDNEKCVEARSPDMKWNDISCKDSRAYICSVRKRTRNTTASDQSDIQAECKCSAISFKALIGVTVCIVLVLILLCIVVYYFRPWAAERSTNSTAVTIQPPSPPARQRYRSAEIKIKEEDPYYEEMGS